MTAETKRPQSANANASVGVRATKRKSASKTASRRPTRVNAPRYGLPFAVARAIALEPDVDAALGAFVEAVRDALPTVQDIERRRMTVPTAQSQHPAVVAELKRRAL